jgi:xanthine dehydrogenase molybdopterin-binding subunit B
MNVTLVPGFNKDPANVMGSKASGEPGYMLGIGTFFALKNAVYEVKYTQTCTHIDIHTHRQKHKHKHKQKHSHTNCKADI